MFRWLTGSYCCPAAQLLGGSSQNHTLHPVVLTNVNRKKLNYYLGKQQHEIALIRALLLPGREPVQPMRVASVPEGS